MRVGRSFTVTKRILWELRNDKRTIALIFIAPILVMSLFGFTFSGEVKDVNVAVVDYDEGLTLSKNYTLSFSEEIISNLNRETLKIDNMDNADDAIHKLEDGKVYAAIIFPANFTRDMYAKFQNQSYSANASIQVKLDKSNIDVANSIVKSVNDAVYTTMKNMNKGTGVNIDTEAVYGKNAKFMDFFAPGVIAFAVYLLTTLLTLISFVGERTSGTLDRLLTTPLKESEIVTGYAIAFSIIGIVQTALLLIVGIAVFDIMIVGNILLAFAVIALLAIVCQSLGILLSSLAKRESQAVQFIPFIVLPAFLLAGIFWPIEAIPLWLRPASYLIPPTYAVDACRSIMLRGWGLTRIWTDIAALLVFTTVFLIVAIWSLKRRR